MDLHCETLPGGTRLYTGAGWPITTDAMLLASFCRIRPSFSACDLGAGSGILLFSLLDRGLRGRCVAVEQDPAAAAALQASADANNFTHLTVIQGDLRTYKTGRPFDIVVANPPYHATGAVPAAPQRAAASHQHSCTPRDICAAAYRLLKDGGRFFVCWPAAGLPVMLSCLQQHQLAAKRLQLVRKTAKDNARLALLEACKNGGEALAVLPDILMDARPSPAD